MTPRLPILSAAEPHAGSPAPLKAAAQLCAVADACGGCPCIGMTRRAQAESKRDALRRATSSAGVRSPWVRWVGHAGPVGYRNRIRLRVDTGRVVFFNPDKSAACAVLEAGLLQAVARLVAFSCAFPLALTAIAHVELRLDEGGGAVGLALFLSAEAGPGGVSDGALKALRAEAFVPWVSAGAGADPGASDRELPAPAQRSELPGGAYAWVPLTAFRQVNRWTNRRIVGLLLRGSRRRFPDQSRVRFLDLFSGAGNFGLALLAQGARGAFVERDAAALRALGRSAKEQGFDPDQTLAGAAASVLDGEAAQALSVDLLIVNPPRAGLKDALPGAVKLRARYLFAVYCDVGAWARDLAGFASAGYELQGLWAADMFPQTAHQETVAWLRLADSSGPVAL